MRIVLFLNMTLISGATRFRIVFLLKLLARSNLKANSIRVAVHVIFTAVVLDL